ncbi:hypothetical protein SynBIOSE41_02516 [Synechococcus sp. BIOS-E4-1]|uniref:DUF3685 domain-containing protein n=1 Tax=Synechococcus sp. BIOS-E4-1 TaxID=1400864 RepID=UPI00164621F6|nr:DUF3685 domain-containing protein [Synechococcus sp. BIOS-E4-1]QNI55016.1 hypothetical protein SynBIOSE41_02516 [Synechococcus sp. BIOS-E4-1]
MIDQDREILLFAPDLLGESLAAELSTDELTLRVRRSADQLQGHPSLVIWSLPSETQPLILKREILQLQQRWTPAPTLLLLPADYRRDPQALLSLNCDGILQDPDLAALREAVQTLLNGGRVLKIKPHSAHASTSEQDLSMAQWLLVSGLQQIGRDLQVIEALLDLPPEHLVMRLMLEGRCRELRSARNLLLWLWGPLHTGLAEVVPLRDQSQSLELTLSNRQPTAVWHAIQQRLEGAVSSGLGNGTGQLLAIEGLHPERRRDLLLALLQQLHEVLLRLRGDELVSTRDQKALSARWQSLQTEVKQQALRSVAGNYVRLPQGENLVAVADQLVDRTDLRQSDDELPDPQTMLASLVLDQPVLVDGQLLPSDDPRALLQLETLISNWLVRTAELIGSELLGICGEWPELRRYLLQQDLISTRELERLRNQLNSQSRWQDWIERPIRLYESRRLLFSLKTGRIEPLLLTEPRDEELRRLRWWQQQVALIVEARDAIAPQVQALVKRLGDLMVVVLTQVVGRAIGLIGRGIAQGMGRSLGRS